MGRKESNQTKTNKQYGLRSDCWGWSDQTAQELRFILYASLIVFSAFEFMQQTL